MSRDRILSIIGYALRFNVRYPGWKWPRGSERDTEIAAAAILDHLEQSNHTVTPGRERPWHGTGDMSNVRGPMSEDKD